MDLRLIVGEKPDPPELVTDTDLLAAWDTFWSSDLARGVIADTDVHALHRLFRLYQEEVTMSLICHESPMLDGSMGQPIMNPMFRQLTATRGEIRQLEDRFGGNPRARLNLGLSLGQIKRQLTDIAKETHSDFDIDGIEDPRLEADV